MPPPLQFDHPSISKLGQKFKVQGIPTLVLLDAHTGEVITTDARSGISEDTNGAKFPYRPPTVESIFSAVPELAKANGGSQPVREALGKTYLALYFSAHWCPPCRGFTPKAAAWYKQFKASGKPFSNDFEVIFVSSDKSAAEFSEYLGEMPWPALPQQQASEKKELSKLFGVQGIPTMVLLKKNERGVYELENGDLRSKIESDPDHFPWPPKAVETLDAAVEAINDYPTLVAFTDKLTDAAAESALEAALEEVGKEYFSDGKPSDSLRFAVALESDDATEQVRQFVGASKDKDGPTSIRIVLVDVQQQGKVEFWSPDNGAVPTAAALRTFAADYVAGKIPVKSFREGHGGHGHSHAHGESCNH